MRLIKALLKLAKWFYDNLDSHKRIWVSLLIILLLVFFSTEIVLIAFILILILLGYMFLK